ncbi:MAG: amidohydrolase family protein [Anaerolineaceae bacterium]|nr:amidohydrolase family protein [Anaerolineaceae bacterium]
MKKRHVLKFLIILLLIFQPSCSSGISTPKATPEMVKNTPEAAEDQKNAGEQSSLPVIQTPITKSIEVGGPEDNYPDTIFYNGIVLTMEHIQPLAEAIAIRSDKIFAVGSSEGVLALRGPDTWEIDLSGKTLLPGFIDSHGHWIGDDELTNFQNVDKIIQFLVENGWTSINEMFVPPDRLAELLSLDREERLHVRVNAYLPVNYLDQRFERPYLQYSPLEVLSPRVRVAGVKFFTDNDWGHIINWEQSELNEEVKAAHQAGWQIAIHTFSVQGHFMVLEALGSALEGADNRAYRHRIEHVIAITDEQLTEIKQRGYIASIQLNFPGNIPQADPTFYDKVPEEDFPLLTRWKDILEAGITIAGGTDWPWFTNDTFIEIGGAPAGSPLRLIYEAATHTDTNNRIPDSWMRGQLLPVKAALQSLTINGAYATFEEDVKGSLAPGKYADIVILSNNPLTMPVEKLIEIEVLMTMIGGNVEYCADGAKALCEQGAQDVVKTNEQTQEITPEDMVIVLP